MLFAAALQIQEPLYVKKVEFLKDEGELHMHIDFRKGAKFRCPVCGIDGLSIHDTIEKTWRHLNFFQYKAFIHYRTPRTECPKHGTHLVDVPWGGSNSGFTLLFEALIMHLAKCMPISQLADIIDEHDTKLWRIISKYVNTAQASADYSDMERVGLDETSSKKGHNYVTNWAVRCRLEPVKAFARTMKANWSGILNHFDSNLTNAALEGMNSIVQAARARTRGYRNVNNFITMIYLLAGKLNFNFQLYKEIYHDLEHPKLPLPT